MVGNTRIMRFPLKGDERGNLVVIEGNIDVPFSIQRIFYIFGADKESIRGKHANRKSEFVFVNVSGSSKIKIDDGLGNQTVYELNKPYEGLYIPSMIWKEMYDFTEDCVLMVLSNERYDDKEYIRDYNEYLYEVKSEGEGCK